MSTISDPSELIRLHETGWANCDIDTKQLIRKAKEWDAGFGLKIFLVTDDSFAAKIMNKEPDYSALAEEVHEMCSDAGNTGTTMEENAEQIRKSGEIYLWWD